MWIQRVKSYSVSAEKIRVPKEHGDSVAGLDRNIYSKVTERGDVASDGLCLNDAYDSCFLCAMCTLFRDSHPNMVLIVGISIHSRSCESFCNLIIHHSLE